MIDELEIYQLENRYNTKMFFDLISGNIKMGYVPQMKILTNKNRTLITDDKQIFNEFKHFFEKLLKQIILQY